MVWSW